MKPTNKSRAIRFLFVAIFAAMIWIAEAVQAKAQFAGVQCGPRAFATAPTGTQALASKTMETGEDLGYNAVGRIRYRLF